MHRLGESYSGGSCLRGGQVQGMNVNEKVRPRSVLRPR
jgi:hypothetical protein